MKCEAFTNTIKKTDMGVSKRYLSTAKNYIFPDSLLKSFIGASLPDSSYIGSYIGAAVSGLALFFAVLHTVFLLSWVALVPLFFVLEQASPRLASQTGSWTGLVLAVCTFSWMIPGAETFTGAPVIYGIAIFLLCTIIFSAGWAVLCRVFVWLRNRHRSFRLWGRHRSFLPEALLAAALWTLAEAGLQGAAQAMPWFLFHMGNALSANLYAIQPVSWIGVGGAGFVVVFVNYCLAQALIHRSWKRSLWPIFTIAAYMLLGWGLLAAFEKSQPSARAFTLSLIAENIPPEVRWDETNGNRLVKQLLDLERQSVATRPDMIGWSESAIPWTYRPDDDLVRELLRVSDPAKITHLIGINTESTANEIYNSAYCLLPGGAVSGRYDKKVPLLLIEQSWNGWSIPFFSAEGYTVRPGEAGLPLATPYGNAGILICNESALPAEAADRVRRGARFLFNMSNDGWFRDTYLVSQHFYNARLRAVETRKDIAINSNNGWSGLVRASGRIVEARRSEISFISTLSIRPNDLQPLAVTHPGLPVECSLLIVLLFVLPSVTRLQTFFRHRLPNYKPVK
ncbi:MAG TPA: apolipoprotein N-acyltransferase [Puia sp.]|nr:apolipoprotein N-acyltransferase [Puia sp.]